MRQREGPLRRRRGQPRQPGPGAAAAAAVREAQAANGTREPPLLLRRRCRQPDPDRPHPLRRGPPEVSCSYPVSAPCSVCEGAPLPLCPAQRPPPPHLGLTAKLPSRWQLHPGFLLHPFFPSLGSSSAFWLPLLFSSALCPGIPPSLTLIPVASVPNYFKSSTLSTSRRFL